MLGFGNGFGNSLGANLAEDRTLAHKDGGGARTDLGDRGGVPVQQVAGQQGRRPDPSRRREG